MSRTYDVVVANVENAQLARERALRHAAPDVLGTKVRQAGAGQSQLSVRGSAVVQAKLRRHARAGAQGA